MNENLTMIQELLEDIKASSMGASTKYSKVELEDKLREASILYFGKTNPSYKDMRGSKGEAYFALLEEYIAERGSTLVRETLPFVDFRNEAWGDDTVFEIENRDLFNVMVVAKGNGNVLRQRIVNKTVVIEKDALVIKIFDNFKRFLAGRVNWVSMIEKVAQSYAKEIQERIMTAFYNTAPVNGNATFNKNDAGGFEVDTVRDLIDHVQAENQDSEVAIVGTRQALINFAPVIATDEANKDMYEKGYYTTAEGYKLIPVRQMHKKNTFDFLLDNKQVMVIPMTDEPMVKVVEEGNPIITDRPLNEGDMSKEYLFYTEVGVGVITGSRYGRYTWG